MFPAGAVARKHHPNSMAVIVKYLQADVIGVNPSKG